MEKNIQKKQKNGPASRRQAKASRGGYTIIETMIAVSLFIVIVMMGMNALLNANLVNNKSQKMRAIMDNMSFVIEDMSRNLRTGVNYDCIPYNGSIPGSAIATNGYSCGGIAFNPASGGNVWVYYIGVNPNIPSSNSIFKVIDGATVQMTPDEVSIDSISGFSVLGATSPLSGDKQQPFVIIKMVGKITYKGVVTPFSLQTSVSQRKIDI